MQPVKGLIYCDDNKNWLRGIKDVNGSRVLNNPETPPPTFIIIAK